MLLGAYEVKYITVYYFYGEIVHYVNLEVTADDEINVEMSEGM